MSAFYGTTDDVEGVETIRRALELGVDFIDTAQLYGPLTNELLVGRAVAGRRDEYVIATKFNRRMNDAVPGDMSTVGPQDGSAAHVRSSIEGSLRRLGTDYVDLYYQHRVDPNVPIEDAAGTVKDLIAEGKVKHFGMSEAAAKTSVGRTRSSRSGRCRASTRWWRRPEEEVLPTCDQLSIGLPGSVSMLGTTTAHWPGIHQPDNGEPEHPAAGGARSRGSGRTAR
jgi:aryl-alcohol dehydrogenase-like predicted oxidoreductase